MGSKNGAWHHFNKCPTKEKAEQARDLYTRQFIARVEAMMEDFVEEFQVNENLTSLDRRRLTGAGVRNNGFMDKAA